MKVRKYCRYSSIKQLIMQINFDKTKFLTMLSTLRKKQKELVMSLNNNTLGNSVKASKKIAKKARRRILFRMKVLVERGETSSEEFIQAGEDFPWTYCYRDIEILKNINYIYA